MFDNSILFLNDYKQIIEYCCACNDSDYIEDFIRRILKKYFKNNPRIIGFLIWRIEDEYTIKYNNEYETDEGNLIMHEENFIFTDMYPVTIDNPQIHWLYSYLWHLSNNNWILEEIVAEEESRQLTKNIKVDPSKSFSCDYDVEKMIELYSFLVAKKIIKGTLEQKQFINIFNHSNLEDIVPIEWLLKTNRGMDNKSIFLFLHFLYPIELNSDCGNKLICVKIQKCFKGSDLKSLQSGYSNWHPELEIPLIMKTIKPNNGIYNLLTYLQEHFH